MDELPKHDRSQMSKIMSQIRMDSPSICTLFQTEGRKRTYLSKSFSPFWNRLYISRAAHSSRDFFCLLRNAFRSTLVSKRPYDMYFCTLQALTKSWCCAIVRVSWGWSRRRSARQPASLFLFQTKHSNSSSLAVSERPLNKSMNVFSSVNEDNSTFRMLLVFKYRLHTFVSSGSPSSWRARILEASPRRARSWVILTLKGVLIGRTSL